MVAKLNWLLFFLLFTSNVNSQISVNSSGKYLVETKSGKPFFWLGDTGWELFHRLTREEAIEYLDTRKKQGFNVIQTVALAENDGLRTPNRYGDVPFKNLDPTQWDVTAGASPTNTYEYDYWDNVDYVINEAAKRNLYVGLLPTWGDKVAYMWGEGPKVFNEKNAYAYAKKLAERYKDQWNIIWILGGDRPATYERNGKRIDDRPVWNAMAKGIEDVFGSKAFITYHPGGTSDGSSKWFHNEPWLDMNALQSGHGSREVPVWDFVRKDLSFKPTKPVLDMEPCYEAHPVNPWDGRWTRQGRGYFSSAEIRGRIYRSVFAGACGLTYGHHSVWQFLDTTLYPPINTGDTTIHWRNALHAPVAGQILHLKKLMNLLKDHNRVEDSLLIASNKGINYRDLIIATRTENKKQAMIYLPQPRPIRINLDRLRRGNKMVSWFNPVTGELVKVNKRYKSDIHQFTPPSGNQPDWVLLINVK